MRTVLASSAVVACESFILGRRCLRRSRQPGITPLRRVWGCRLLYNGESNGHLTGNRRTQCLGRPGCDSASAEVDPWERLREVRSHGAIRRKPPFEYAVWPSIPGRVAITVEETMATAGGDRWSRSDDDILPGLDIVKGHCRVRSTQLLCGGGPMPPVRERTLGFPVTSGSRSASAPCSVGSRHMNREAR